MSAEQLAEMGTKGCEIAKCGTGTAAFYHLVRGQHAGNSDQTGLSTDTVLTDPLLCGLRAVHVKRCEAVGRLGLADMSTVVLPGGRYMRDSG